ncbi:molybdopterin molybdochelatase [Orbus hercynius]|uniref:Molybdopterin molybdenumtransferase n=1 Tax=Orbus hercynius TaxID=593135 RepID=A0A495RJ26_9GAMM|nr:molybdopterin molybdotransferase MoeA [Orbus hercynius]RKS87369.1 molybdopterin molybdochelatase [Orbus hercynius]
MDKAPLLLFSEARDLILQAAKSINYHKTESIPLFEAVNRIVAHPVISPMNVPSFNNSAMDGYVIRQTDLASSQALPIAGSLFAGQKQSVSWPKNSCLRIMTGAKVPDDAYAVIMQEDVQKQGESISFDADKIKQGQNIRYIGESIKIGSEIFTTGEKLSIAKLSTLATLGLKEITVFKPLKVAIFSTGDELTPIGEPLVSANQIYDSNRFTLHLMLKALGCDVINLGILQDDLALITDTLKQAANQADIVITSGGVSVGDADYTKMALEQIGKIDFWKIAIKPGKPFAFGQIDNAFFCGLPGNPVSALVTFYQLVRPLILTQYQVKHDQHTLLLKTTSQLKKSLGRVDFQRGRIYSNAQGERVVESTGEQGSHITSSFNQANCFIILEKDRGHVRQGELVTVEPFDSTLL